MSDSTELTPRPLAELREHGLLWLINRTVFHPRGYALALEVDEQGDVTGWALMGEGDEPWRYAPQVNEAELFAKAEAFFASMRSHQESS